MQKFAVYLTSTLAILAPILSVVVAASLSIAIYGAAKRMKCVFAVPLHTGSRYKPPARQATDAQITAQVRAKVASDVGASSLANVNVNTTNGVVTLAGEVESPEVKSLAESVAAAVTGVSRVNNNLQVAPSAASAGH